jgi:curved DNA-binding protein CbpA
MPQLDDFPLAELLRELDLKGLSGAVRLQREPARAVIYLESGKPVFAATNIKELRLGEYLVKRGLVSRDAMARLNNTADGALAKELLRQSILKPNDLERASGSLVNDIILVLLLWTTGWWEYDERARLADSFRTSIDISSFLLAGARKMSPQFISTRFPDHSEKISTGAQVANVDDLLPHEGFVLSRLEQPTPLNELLSLSGQPEQAALQTIYGLALSGIVQRSSWPTSLETTSSKPAKPTPVPTPQPVFEKPVETDEKELERFFAQIETSQNHYEVLNLSPSAALDEIKRAYYALARLYHPDRFHANTQIHRRIESAFARITQAYEALNDPALRSKYDNRLAAQEKLRSMHADAPGQQDSGANRAAPLTAAQQSAEMSYREGYAALQSGQISRALTHFAAAASSAPNEPRYRAFYGKVLAANAKTQRLAEAEFQAAVKLDPNNASYHLMLAQLYYDLTFFKRARAEAARALELDRNETEALALLRKMKNK